MSKKLQRDVLSLMGLIVLVIVVSGFVRTPNSLAVHNQTHYASLKDTLTVLVKKSFLNTHQLTFDNAGSSKVTSDDFKTLNTFRAKEDPSKNDLLNMLQLFDNKPE